MKLTVNIKPIRVLVRFWRSKEMPGNQLEVVKGKPRCSIPTTVYHHSPDGIEWGYGGSGPADCALNILAHFLPLGCDGCLPVVLFKGVCSQVAWDLHQRFKTAFIANLEPLGGYIEKTILRKWIYEAVIAWVEKQTLKDLYTTQDGIEG